MSGRRRKGQTTGAKKEESGSGASGLLSSLMLAGGAAAVGFLAHKLYTDYNEEQELQQQHCSARSSNTGASTAPGWGEVDPKDSKHSRKQNRSTVAEDVPDAVKCVVCMDHPREIILIPCGHVCLCEDCAEKIGKCPICMEFIKHKKNAYIP